VQAPTSASGNKPVHILLACQHLTRLELIQCRVLPSLQVSGYSREMLCWGSQQKWCGHKHCACLAVAPPQWAPGL
jgi:hypothetical protein